jgi:hypothetical protein
MLEFFFEKSFTIINKGDFEIIVKIYKANKQVKV